MTLANIERAAAAAAQRTLDRVERNARLIADQDRREQSRLQCLKDELDLIEETIHSGLWSYHTEEPSFSHTGCHRCRCLNDGRKLGADVYQVKAYRNLEEAHEGPGNLFTWDLCGPYIYTLEYGEG